MNAPVRVIIIGCGFGGLFAAKALRGAAVQVIIVDRTNHHLFQPLLYQVATAGLSAPAIAAPIRHVLARQRNVTVLMGEVTGIDRSARIVELEDGQSLPYDYLIVAAGATHSYFGRDEWQLIAPGLKTLEDAFAIRRRILMAFEHAERTADDAERREWLTFAVVGAGATGVEMAGTLAEIARHTLRGEFRQFDSHSARVMLIEGGDRVLPAFIPALSRKAQAQLERLGVHVLLNSRVTKIDESGLTVGEQRIDARTVVWAAGVAASPLGKALGVPLDRAGRVIVEPDLNLPGDDRVYVIGDLAAATSAGKPVPGVSPAAKQMGSCAAANIVRTTRGQMRQAFRYRDYGSLATIGRKAAVADFNFVRLWGLPAWLMWLFAHLFFLIGFRNRLMVMTDWAWAYLTFQRSARVMAEPIRRNH